MKSKELIYRCKRGLLCLYLLAVLGVMAGIVHLPALLIFSLIVILMMDRMEMAVSVLLIFPPFLGILFQVYGLSIPGTVVALLLAMVLIRMTIIRIFILNRKALVYSTFVVVIFLYYFYATGKTDYSKDKIIELCITAVVYFLAASTLVSSSSIDSRKIGKLYLLYALVMTCIGIEVVGYENLSGIFDFTTFRETANFFQNNIEIAPISYHSVGEASMIGMALYISYDRKMRYMDYFVIVAFFWIILMSGLRQALVGGIFLLLVRYILFHQKLSLLDLLKISFIGLILAFVLILLDIETINNVFNSKNSVDESLNRNYDYPISILTSHFFDGIGFGNYYNSFSDEVYPHNILLELLCEIGFLGTSLLLFIVVFFCIHNRFSLHNKLKCGSFAVILFIPFLICSLISYSIGHNISIFVLLFVLFAKTKNNLNTN